MSQRPPHSGQRALEIREWLEASGVENWGRWVAVDDRALLANPSMDMKVSQGVTTVVVGNCGISLAPLVNEAPPATSGSFRKASRGRR